MKQRNSIMDRLSKLSLNSKSDDVLQEIVKFPEEYEPYVVDEAVAILKQRDKFNNSIADESDSKRATIQTPEAFLIDKVEECATYLKTIKNCVIFFTVLMVISIVIFLISSFILAF